jgi:hypothetical protein
MVPRAKKMVPNGSTRTHGQVCQCTRLLFRGSGIKPSPHLTSTRPRLVQSASPKTLNNGKPAAELLPNIPDRYCRLWSIHKYSVLTLYYNLHGGVIRAQHRLLSWLVFTPNFSSLAQTSTSLASNDFFLLFLTKTQLFLPFILELTITRSQATALSPIPNFTKNPRDCHLRFLKLPGSYKTLDLFRRVLLASSSPWQNTTELLTSLCDLELS